MILGGIMYKQAWVNVSALLIESFHHNPQAVVVIALSGCSVTHLFSGTSLPQVALLTSPVSTVTGV